MPLVKMHDAKTNTWKEVEMSDEQIESLKTINDVVIDNKQINAYIDNLQISPELKVVLDTLLNYSMKVGDLLLNIGRKIVEVIIYFIQNYPNMITGAIIGFTIGTIISSIPLLGWALSWLILPLSTAIGMGMGLKIDLQDKGLEIKIRKETAELFRTMQDIKV